MSIEIDCPECGGSGYIAEYPEYNIEIDDVPKCPDCKDGKIRVYTQAEVDQIVRDICESFIPADKLEEAQEYYQAIRNRNEEIT